MAHYARSRNGMGDIDPVTLATTGMDEADYMFMATDYLLQAGVANKEAGDFSATSSGLDVTVTSGCGYVLNSAWTRNADASRFRSDNLTASTTVTLDSNTSGSTRIDLICIKLTVATAPDGTASNVFSIFIEKGTPGSPVPSVPADCEALYEASLPTGSTTITLTDRRRTAFIDGKKVFDGDFTQHTITYVSASSFKLTGDWTWKFKTGMQIQLYNDSKTKWSFVVSSTYASGETTVTTTDFNYDNAGTLTVVGLVAGTITSLYVGDHTPSHPGWLFWTCTRYVSGGNVPTYAVYDKNQFTMEKNTARLKILWKNSTGGTAGSSANRLEGSLPTNVAINSKLFVADYNPLGFMRSYESGGTIGIGEIRSTTSSGRFMMVYNGNPISGDDQSNADRSVIGCFDLPV